MKFIDDYAKNKTKPKIEIGFNKNGSEAVSNQKQFAKIIEETDSENKTYYVSTNNNQIYDPLGVNSNREQYLDINFKRVSKNTFDFYMIYLQTNNSIYLTRANRSFLND